MPLDPAKQGDLVQARQALWDAMGDRSLVSTIIPFLAVNTEFIARVGGEYGLVDYAYLYAISKNRNDIREIIDALVVAGHTNHPDFLDIIKDSETPLVTETTLQSLIDKDLMTVEEVRAALEARKITVPDDVPDIDHLLTQFPDPAVVVLPSVSFSPARKTQLITNIKTVSQENKNFEYLALDLSQKYLTWAATANFTDATNLESFKGFITTAFQGNDKLIAEITILLSTANPAKNAENVVGLLGAINTGYQEGQERLAAAVIPVPVVIAPTPADLAESSHAAITTAAIAEHGNDDWQKTLGSHLADVFRDKADGGGIRSIVVDNAKLDAQLERTRNYSRESWPLIDADLKRLDTVEKKQEYVRALGEKLGLVLVREASNEAIKFKAVVEDVAGIFTDVKNASDALFGVMDIMNDEELKTVVTDFLSRHTAITALDSSNYTLIDNAYYYAILKGNTETISSLISGGFKSTNLNVGAIVEASEISDAMMKLLVTKNLITKEAADEAVGKRTGAHVTAAGGQVGQLKALGAAAAAKRNTGMDMTRGVGAAPAMHMFDAKKKPIEIHPEAQSKPLTAEKWKDIVEDITAKIKGDGGKVEGDHNVQKIKVIPQKGAERGTPYDIKRESHSISIVSHDPNPNTCAINSMVESFKIASRHMETPICEISSAADLKTAVDIIRKLMHKDEGMPQIIPRVTNDELLGKLRNIANAGNGQHEGVDVRAVMQKYDEVSRTLEAKKGNRM